MAFVPSVHAPPPGALPTCRVLSSLNRLVGAFTLSPSSSPLECFANLSQLECRILQLYNRTRGAEARAPLPSPRIRPALDVDDCRQRRRRPHRGTSACGAPCNPLLCTPVCMRREHPDRLGSSSAVRLQTTAEAQKPPGGCCDFSHSRPWLPCLPALYARHSLPLTHRLH